MISWSTVATESMYQAIAIAYLPASESCYECRLWAPHTIKFKLYKMESDICKLLFGHSVESLGQSDQ